MPAKWKVERENNKRPQTPRFVVERWEKEGMQDVHEMVPDPEWNRVPDSLDETAYMGQKFTVTQTFRRLPVPSPPKEETGQPPSKCVPPPPSLKVEPHQSLSQGENESEKKRQRRKSGTKVDEGEKTSDRGKIDTGGNVDMRGKDDKLVKPAGSSQQSPVPNCSACHARSSNFPWQFYTSPRLSFYEPQP
jgi:hypothetical protein